MRSEDEKDNAKEPFYKDNQTNQQAKEKDKMTNLSPTEAKNARVLVRQACDAMAIIAGARDTIKQLAKEAKEQFDISPKLFRQLAKMRYNLDRDIKEMETNELFEAYELLFEEAHNE